MFLLLPQLVETKKSDFNGEIKVLKQYNQYIFTVDTLTQSGGLLVPIWRKALKQIHNSKFLIHNSLILGLGGGTSAKLINHFWPQAQITGLEIDSQMITLAKKYMKLDQIPNLKIIQADAFKYKSKIKYELILVDTYQGKTYPQQAQSLKFFKLLKSILAPQGLVVFNRLNWGQNQNNIKAHIATLKKIFEKVATRQILSNTLVYCSKSE